MIKMSGTVKCICIVIALSQAWSAVWQVVAMCHGGSMWRLVPLAVNFSAILIYGRAIDRQQDMRWAFGFIPVWSDRTRHQ